MFNIINNFNSNNSSKPYIKCTLTKDKYYYVCNTNMYGFSNNAKIVVTAFKNEEIVSLTIHDYSKPKDKFYIFTDFDFVIITISNYNEKTTNILAMNILIE